MCLTQAGIAQPVEHFTRNEGVVSSSLISSLTDMGLALWDECESWGARLFLFGFMEGENVGVGKGSVRGMESWYARGMWHRFGEKAGRQRERISARASTPSGDTTKVP